jgi:hypothetical protein
MNKKVWLDKLYYDLGKQQYDFRISGLTKKGDKIISTKWKKYSEVCFGLNPWDDKKLWWVNNREILPNEVVIDLENKKYLRPIIKKLKKYNSSFYVFDTHSRGYHIHLFFNKPIEEEQKRAIIKQFLGDEQKAYFGSTIALEYTNHWKSGKIKELMKDGGNANGKY